MEHERRLCFPANRGIRARFVEHLEELFAECPIRATFPLQEGTTDLQVKVLLISANLHEPDYIDF
jgi:hypothetical protein